MKRKYKVDLSKEERLRVFKAVDSKTTPQTVRKRCNILLHADTSAGKPATQEEIAVRCGVSDVCVYQTVKDYSLNGLDYVLRRRKHANPPRKPVDGGEDEARIVALACGGSPEGYALSRSWLRRSHR